jgi:anti-sigma regulatory factor (Ser/Thr protein kinase)
VAQKAQVLELRLKNPGKEKWKVLAALRDFVSARGLPAVAFNAADLALEEHLTNIEHYGYADKRRHIVLVRLSLGREDFTVEVWDDCKSFNPLRRPEVDTSTSLAEKRIGGLGIHLMRHFMDELSYRRLRGKNLLTMRKRLGTPRQRVALRRKQN